jgi:hypothetical protein
MICLPIEEKGWKLYPETCPPDIHFIDYLEKEKFNLPVRIFHMGPGLHHIVGLWATQKKGVYVRSLTITPSEMVEYMKLAAEDASINASYLVDFGDIHLLIFDLLPTEFDYISLFHLGEISKQIKNPDYNGWFITDLLSEFSNHLRAGGKILFFAQSVAWKDIQDEVDRLLVGILHYVRSSHKSLLIYQKPREE